jgi:Domain of unknown function (DUF5666)
MDDQIWNPPSTPDTGMATDDPPEGQLVANGHAGPAAFTGRTPGRGAAVRAGIVAGAVLVVAVGAAVVLAASPSSAPGSGAGAGPSATTGQGAPERGNGRGPAWKGPFGLGGPGRPSAIGPFGGFGPGLGFGREGLGGPGGRLEFGGITVTAVSGSDISLKTADGWTRTITVSSSTTITKGGQPATISDVKVGDMVRFAEKRNADGTFSITKLAVVLPETAGTVTAVGADTITITRPDGTTETVGTTGSTTYQLGGAAGSRSDVKVGSLIAAVGERGSDGRITATTIQIVLPRVLGTVTAVGSDSLTLRRPDGTTVTVHVGSGTSIAVRGAASAKLSDIKVGMVAAVQGTQRSDGSLDASAIRAGQLGKLRPDKPDRPNAPNATSSPATTTG